MRLPGYLPKIDQSLPMVVCTTAAGWTPVGLVFSRQSRVLPSGRSDHV